MRRHAKARPWLTARLSDLKSDGLPPAASLGASSAASISVGGGASVGSLVSSVSMASAWPRVARRTVSCSCRALARMCRDDEGREAAADLLEPLVVALQAHGENDAAVARHGCTAIVGLCRRSADDQARAAALGAFAAAAACARVHPQHLTQACAAVEGLCTGKGAAARREVGRGSMAHAHLW